MKQLTKLIGALVTLTISQPVLADDITDTYTTGDTLTVSTMNNIKSAVNSKQDRVTGTCPAGTAIASINSNGTVVCEADDDSDTLASLSCSEDDFAKWNGSSWVCSGTTIKRIPIALGDVYLDEDSLFLLDGIVTSDETAAYSINFRVPDDYDINSDIILELTWASDIAPNGTVDFRKSQVNSHRAGSQLVRSNAFTLDPQPVDTAAFPPETVFTTEFTVNDPISVLPGDAIIFSFVRDGAAAADTSTQGIRIVGLAIRYTGSE